MCIISEPSVNSNWSYSLETPNSGKNHRFLSRATLKFGRWPWKIIEHPHLLCDFKLCASFRSHLWIQTGVTVRKRPIWVMIDDFCPVWPWQLTDAIETQRDTYAMLIWTCCIFSKPLMNPNFSYNAETPNLGQNLWIFIPCDLEILTDVLDKQ